MVEVKEKKKYVYDYPENRALGKELRGMAIFITTKLLKNKYSRTYVNCVMNGTRKNSDIEAAMQRMKELLQTEN